MEEERKAERRRRARERMVEISPTLEDIAGKFGVSKYLAHILYNTLRGQKRSWNDFKQVELKGVQHIMEELNVPPHTAYYFYRITTKAIDDWQNVDWHSIAETDWQSRYASDEYKGQIMERLKRYGVTEIREETEEWAIEMEQEEFAKTQISEVLKEYYEEGLDDDRVDAIKESSDIVLQLAQEGDVKAKIALGDFTNIPLQKFLRPHELEVQKSRATKTDIELVKKMVKGLDVETLTDALKRGKFLGRVIFKPLREVIAYEIESRRPEEMAAEMIQEPYALTPHLLELIKVDDSLSADDIGERRAQLGLKRSTLKQLIDGVIWRRDQMEDIYEDLTKLGADEEDVTAIRQYVRSRWEEVEGEVPEPAVAHEGVIRETIKGLREQMERLTDETLKRVDEKLGEIAERAEKIPKKLPPPKFELVPKEVPPPVFITMPTKDTWIETELHPEFCPMHIREEQQRLAEEMYGKAFYRLGFTERTEVERTARENVSVDPTAIVMRNPELEFALQMIRDPRGYQWFPKEPALYELCEQHFHEVGYDWDNTITQKVFEFVRERRVLSVPDFERVGIPREWVEKQIDVAEAERMARLGVQP